MNFVRSNKLYVWNINSPPKLLKQTYGSILYSLSDKDENVFKAKKNKKIYLWNVVEYKIFSKSTKLLMFKYYFLELNALQVYKGLSLN